jgi:5-methylthioribose kinase
MASSYHFLENILRDVFVNKEVVDGKNIPVLSDTLHDLYKHKLFEETDYIKERKHKQFAYAIVREVFVPEEQCTIDPQIRKIISRFQKAGILQKATN